MQWKSWVVTFAAASSALVFGACRADDSIKQGIEGEFCNNRDDDCRDGHICDDGVCRALESDGSVTCGQMCAHLEQCQAGEENCEADCRATLQGTCDGLPCPWSAEAVDSFGNCILELSCDEAAEVDAPQVCYRGIPIATDRQNRCDSFIAAATRCNADADTGELRNRCYLLGRTNTEDSWTRTDACVDRVNGGLCAEIQDCYNTVFELEPGIQLGDAQIGEPTPTDG